MKEPLIDIIDIEQAKAHGVIIFCDGTNSCYWVSVWRGNEINSTEQQKEFIRYQDAIDYCRRHQLKIMHDDGDILPVKQQDYHYQLHSGNYD